MAYNSTIISKKKKCVSCGTTDYIFSKGKCKQCATVASTYKRMEKAMEPEERDELKDLIEDIDYWFSRYIRLKYTNEKGKVRCYTGDTEMDWQTSQCGHFIPRAHMATRWLPENCRPQSQYENCVLSGNLDVFKERLEQEQPGLPEWLLEQSREVCKWSREDLKFMLSDFRNKAKVLEKKIKK